MNATASPNFSALLNSLTQDSNGGYSAIITESWMQGRTTYGGLSAALCLKAIELEFQDLAPLRSAQINFIGPTGGKISIKTKVLRQGRSVSYISAEIFGDKGLATHAVFCFGSHRKSHLNESFTKTPEVADVNESKAFFNNIWARHKDTQANDLVALIGVADMPPPAVLPMFKEFAPISSMTWMMNFLSEDIQTKDGWWLLRTAAEHARDGYSSQDMQIWNTDGELVVSGHQNVAIFY